MLKASPYAAVDNVPVVICEKLQAPRKVADPLQHHSGNATDMLFLEYKFYLEEQVLATVHILGDAEKQQYNGSKKTVSNAVISVRQSVDSNIEKTSSAPSETSRSTSAQPNRLLKQQPVGIKMRTSDILMPVQIKKTTSNVDECIKKPTVTKALFDLSDFENEEDPFDKMELRTLDDLEELNKVLFVDQSLNNTGKKDSVHDVIYPPANFVNHFGELNVEVCKPNAHTSNVHTTIENSMETEHLQKSVFKNPMLSSCGQFIESQNACQSNLVSHDGLYQVMPTLRSTKSNPDLSSETDVQSRQTSHTPPPDNMHAHLKP